jgi:hypothetical protein
MSRSRPNRLHGMLYGQPVALNSICLTSSTNQMAAWHVCHGTRPTVWLTACALPCGFQAAFARQVYLLTRLNHPNLVRCEIQSILRPQKRTE